jgi:hypothetical protein
MGKLSPTAARVLTTSSIVCLVELLLLLPRQVCGCWWLPWRRQEHVRSHYAQQCLLGMTAASAAAPCVALFGGCRGVTKSSARSHYT